MYRNITIKEVLIVKLLCFVSMANSVSKKINYMFL